MLSVVLSQIPESCKQKPAKIINVHKEFERQLDFKIVKFPARKKAFVKIQKQNNTSINVFGCEDETPYHIYTSKQTNRKNILIC